MTKEELIAEDLRLQKRDDRDGKWMYCGYACYLAAFAMFISVPIDYILSNKYHTGKPDLFWLGFLIIPFIIAGKMFFRILKKHSLERRKNLEALRSLSTPLAKDAIIECYKHDAFDNAFIEFIPVSEEEAARENASLNLVKKKKRK